MTYRLLISDANILIDMEVSGLINLMFDLPYEYMTPESLFVEELDDSHADLIQLGLQLEQLSPEHMQRMQELSENYKGVSNHDVAALALAEGKGVSLLTGDRKLRQVCLEEKVEVYGTLWLMDQLFAADLITAEDAEMAYGRMEEDGSRLPWDEVKKQINRFRRSQ